MARDWMGAMSASAPPLDTAAGRMAPSTTYPHILPRMLASWPCVAVAHAGARRSSSMNHDRMRISRSARNAVPRYGYATAHKRIHCATRMYAAAAEIGCADRMCFSAPQLSDSSQSQHTNTDHSWPTARSRFAEPEGAQNSKGRTNHWPLKPYTYSIRYEV